jgi:A/G-specific adenine glycosylase
MEEWFSRTLIKWYIANKRDLPWRHETDAYKIWLSEIILQQTQVVQGLAYYHRFVENYPRVTALAAAPEDEVMKLWQGLGYYSRARNLREAAQTIVIQHKGVFPSKYLEIRNLKGVGDYTAAAVASFAFGLPHAVVDGNVYRLLSRIFGVETPIDSPAGKKQFAELATRLLDSRRPGLHNQAIMEFGSQYCRPVKPDCDSCVFRNRCLAFASGRVTMLPVKSKKIKVKNRYLNYVLVVDKKGDTLINRREENDIWKGLYEFCLIETSNEITATQLFAKADFTVLTGDSFTVKHTSKLYKHILSHQILYARFYVVGVKKVKALKGQTKTNIKKLGDFAFPRLIEKFLTDCELKEML